MLGQYCRIAKSIRGRAPVVPADAGGLLDARPGSQRDFPEPLVGTCHANPSAACHVPGLGVPAVGQSRMRGRQDLALFLRSLAFKDIKILLERFGGGGLWTLYPCRVIPLSIPIYLRGTKGGTFAFPKLAEKPD